jgi:phosphoglycolate phosphatase-like HAD superfamily hydrolase
MNINQIKFRYGMKSNALIFFGDSNSDLDAAENANIDFILIKNRFNKKLVKSFTGKIIENFVGF